MTEKRDVSKYILAPEIRQVKDVEIFEFHGKDARGYDFGVRLSPVEALSSIDMSPDVVDADRVNMYAGSDPEKIDQIDTEIEITMGEEGKSYTIDSATMTYVPKGIPYGHRVIGDTDKTSWVLTLTLPPEYIPPEKSDD